MAWLDVYSAESTIRGKAITTDQIDDGVAILSMIGILQSVPATAANLPNARKEGQAWRPHDTVPVVRVHV